MQNIRHRKLLTGLATAILIAIAATPSIAEQPSEKGCPGETTWDLFVTQVLLVFGVTPGEHILGNCL